MEQTKAKEKFIKSSLEIFEANFMVGDEDEHLTAFKRHPDVLEFLERAYSIGGDRKMVDLCLEAIWEDLKERHEI